MRAGEVIAGSRVTCSHLPDGTCASPGRQQVLPLGMMFYDSFPLGLVQRSPATRCQVAGLLCVILSVAGQPLPELLTGLLGAMFTARRRGTANGSDCWSLENSGSYNLTPCFRDKSGFSLGEGRGPYFFLQKYPMFTYRRVFLCYDGYTREMRL